MANLLKQPITDKDHIQGNRNAPVTLLEYGDYECPHCGRAYPIVKRLQQFFDQNLAFVFRHFPFAQIHPHAELAAEAAEAAGAQGRFWDMHDWLFENQDILRTESIVAAAGELELDVESFVADLESHAHLPKVRSDFMGGARSGVNGTPTFFINGVRHDADHEFETLATAIGYVLERVA